VVVALDIHPTRAPCSTSDELLSVLREVAKALIPTDIDSFERLASIEFLRSVGARFIVRDCARRPTRIELPSPTPTPDLMPESTPICFRRAHYGFFGPSRPGLSQVSYSSGRVSPKSRSTAVTVRLIRPQGVIEALAKSHKTPK